MKSSFREIKGVFVGLAIPLYFLIICFWALIVVSIIGTKIDKDVVQDLEEQIKVLEKEKKELQEKYEYEKKNAEYWYYYNVDDAC